MDYIDIGQDESQINKSKPVSVDTLVLVLLFWKIIATLLPSNGLIDLQIEKEKYQSKNMGFKNI